MLFDRLALVVLVLKQVNNAIKPCLYVYRRGSNASQQSIENMKAHFRRRISNASGTGDSNASAHNISIDCEDLREQYIVSSSQRSSIDGVVSAGLTNTAQLEQLTLATYSLFTANSLLPSQTPDKQLSTKNRSKAQSTAHRSNGSSRVASAKSKQLQTPNTGYVNGALQDDSDEDLTDISIS